MNPYASEDFNRFTVKKDAAPQKKGPINPNEPGMIDHPLFEGKKIDMSQNELRNFTHAMGQPEFRSILNDYVKEISDPGNQKELETYLRQLESQGDLPVGTQLIKPRAAFCIKTTAKKLISDINKQYFDQKTFVNVCLHELVEKPQRQFITNPDGKSGYSWQLPYRVSKGRHDQDKDGNLVTTYDVVFHEEVGGFLINDDFKKFVCDTAIDGVNRVLAEHKEKCSSDYKIMKHLICKGGEPGLLTIKVAQENKLLSNYDITKHETSVQKEVNQQNEEFKKKEQDEKLEKDKEERLRKEALGEIGEENENEEYEEPRPKGIVQPKYKIVHSYPVSISDCWEGPSLDEVVDKSNIQKVPNQITITINVPHVESMKLAKLDIDETTLVFQYPDLYYLDLNLKYKCDASNGNAKFDKNKKTLTIRMSVLGLTEDSQKVLDENYQIFLEAQNKRMEEIKKGEEQDKLEKEKQQAQEKLPKIEDALKGESRKILPPIDMSGGNGKIDDKYNEEQEVDLQKLRDEALKQEQQDEEIGTQNNFLKIYKEKPVDEDLVDNSKGSADIKFKRDLDEGDEDTSLIKVLGINERKDGSKPLIQELKSEIIQKDNKSPLKVIQDAKQLEKAEEKFDWETSERIDAKYQFLHQRDFIFINLNYKGYQKDKDLRWAFSENEILIEVRDKQNKVNRLCKTLFREIDILQSSIEQLVDFIVIKLKKRDTSLTWDSLGYDIQNFTIPVKGDMKSNFLKKPEPEVKEEIIKVAEVKSEKADEQQNQDKNEEQQKLESQKDEEELQKTIEKEKEKGKQISFMNLDSSVIYKIY